jgi:hypothetical protein
MSKFDRHRFHSCIISRTEEVRVHVRARGGGGPDRTGPPAAAGHTACDVCVRRRAPVQRRNTVVWYWYRCWQYVYNACNASTHCASSMDGWVALLISGGLSESGCQPRHISSRAKSILRGADSRIMMEAEAIDRELIGVEPRGTVEHRR